MARTRAAGPGIERRNGKADAPNRRSAKRATAKKATVPQPPVTRRAQRGAARREAILTAALAEFSARGFADTRLDDVARRADVAKGTIYLYFRDKEALFQELVRSMLSPLVGAVQAMPEVDLPLREVARGMVEMFLREIYATRRKDVIRLMIAEGQRFPQLAEFYYREVLGPMVAAVGARLARAAAGDDPRFRTLARFPQLLVAPGVVAIVWSGLFGKWAPLDVDAMLHAQLDLLFGETPARSTP